MTRRKVNLKEHHNRPEDHETRMVLRRIVQKNRQATVRPKVSKYDPRTEDKKHFGEAS